MIPFIKNIDAKKSLVLILALIFFMASFKIEWFEYNKTNTFKEKNNKTFNQNLSIIDYIFNLQND